MKLADLSRVLDPQAVNSVRQRLDEEDFRNWYARAAQQYDLAPNPDGPEQFYDYRAAYRAGALPDETGHWPSDFKRAGHPNEIVGGFNTVTARPEPGHKPVTDVFRLVQMGWDPETAQALVQQVKPYRP